jgi:hypothetical protein
VEHKEPGTHYNGAIGKIESGPVVPAEVNVDEVHNSTKPDAIKEV